MTITTSILVRHAGQLAPHSAPIKSFAGDQLGVYAKSLSAAERCDAPILASRVEVLGYGRPGAEAEIDIVLDTQPRTSTASPLAVAAAIECSVGGIVNTPIEDTPVEVPAPPPVPVSWFPVGAWRLRTLENVFPEGSIAISLEVDVPPFRQYGPVSLSSTVPTGSGLVTIGSLFDDERAQRAIDQTALYPETRVAWLAYAHDIAVIHATGQLLTPRGARQRRLVELVCHIPGVDLEARKQSFIGRLRALSEVMGWTSPIVDDLDDLGDVG